MKDSTIDDLERVSAGIVDGTITPLDGCKELWYIKHNSREGQFSEAMKGSNYHIGMISKVVHVVINGTEKMNVGDELSGIILTQEMIDERWAYRKFLDLKRLEREKDIKDGEVIA